MEEELLTKLREFRNQETETYIKYCKDRDYKIFDFESGAEMFEYFEPQGDLENVSREQGYVKGLNDAIRFIEQTNLS